MSLNGINSFWNSKQATDLWDNLLHVIPPACSSQVPVYGNKDHVPRQGAIYGVLERKLQYFYRWH